MYIIGNTLYDDGRWVAHYNNYNPCMEVLHLANQRFKHKNSIPIDTPAHTNTRANGVGIILPGSNPLYRKLADMIKSGQVNDDLCDELMHVFDIMESNYDFAEEYVYDMRYEDDFPIKSEEQEYIMNGDSALNWATGRIQLGDIWYNIIISPRETTHKSNDLDMLDKNFTRFSSLVYQRRCRRVMNNRHNTKSAINLNL